MGLVELLLDQQQPAVCGSLVRDGDRVGEALVAEVAEGAQVVGGVGEGGQEFGMARAAVVSCSRPGRTSEVQIGQPSGTPTT